MGEKRAHDGVEESPTDLDPPPRVFPLLPPRSSLQLYLLRVRDVCDPRAHPWVHPHLPAVELAQARGRGGELGGVAGDERHVGVALDEGFGKREADARGAARDEDVLTRQGGGSTARHPLAVLSKKDADRALEARREKKGNDGQSRVPMLDCFRDEKVKILTFWFLKRHPKTRNVFGQLWRLPGGPAGRRRPADQARRRRRRGGLAPEGRARGVDRQGLPGGPRSGEQRSGRRVRWWW